MLGPILQMGKQAGRGQCNVLEAQGYTAGHSWNPGLLSTASRVPKQWRQPHHLMDLIQILEEYRFQTPPLESCAVEGAWRRCVLTSSGNQCLSGWSQARRREGRVTAAGRERRGTLDRTLDAHRPGPVPALISPKPTPPLCKRLVTHLIPHPAAFISPSFSL